MDAATALGIGGLVGLEREHRRDQIQVIAGVRTFPLFSLAGYLLALISLTAAEPLIIAAAVFVIGGITVSFLWVRHTLGVSGLTSPMAMLVTFLLGVLIGFGYSREAIVVGVAVTFLLLTKQRLHKFAEVLSDDEIMEALQFITISFILFPIARDLQPGSLGVPWIGRGALVDPFQILLVVIFVSAISFAGFVAMRFVGPRRGVAVSGLLGGLVNSEAASASLAGYAKENRALTAAAVLGAVLATLSMFIRNTAIVGFSDPTLAVVRLFVLAIVPAVLVTALIAYRMRKRVAEPIAQRVVVKSPFALGPALKFAAIFAFVSVFTSVAIQASQRANLGEAGVYLVALGGFVGAGAVSASVTALYATGKLSLAVAAQTAALATAMGAANKLIVLRAVDEQVFERARSAFIVITMTGAAGVILLIAIRATGII